MVVVGKLTTIKTFGMGLPLSLVKNMLEDSMNTFHGCVFVLVTFTCIVMISEEWRVLKMQSRVGADYSSFDDVNPQPFSWTCSVKMASEGLRNFG
jgi:hypothetical protein